MRPTNPEELELVRKAISLGEHTRGCCEWNDRAAKRIRTRPPCEGLTPEGIRLLLIDFVSGGGNLAQVREKRPEYRDRRYYYKAIISVTSVEMGLFVEVILTDDDADYPSVEIVNAHEQSA